jgi:autotransporter translocation and assembly factor TamB
MQVVLGGESTTLAFDQLSIRLDGTDWSMSQPTEVRVARSGGIAASDIRVASEAGYLTAGGVIPDSGRAAFSAEVEGIDLGAIARLFPDSLDLGGFLTASAELSGTTARPEIRGSFEVSDGRLVGVPFTSLRGELEFQDDDASLDVSMWDDELRLLRIHGTYPVDLALPSFALSIPEREIRLTAEGDSIPLNLATLFFGNQIAEPHGHAYGTVSIGGTPGSLSLEGPVAFVDGGFRVIYSGITYLSFTGDAFFEGQDLHLINVGFEGVPLRANDSGGRGVLGGRLNLSDLRDPGFDLTIVGDALPLYDQLDARFIVSGSVWLRGRYREPIVGGDISVVSGVLFMDEIGRQAEIADPYLEDSSFLLLDLSAFETARRPANPFLDNLTLDMGVDVAQDT